MDHQEAFHPGAAQFGNFINYYQFNPPSNRLKLIPSNLLTDLSFDIEKQPVIALDIGCNAGHLTWDIYRHLTANDDDNSSSESSRQSGLHILGIDLDSILIERCKEDNPFPHNIHFKVVDFMNAADRESCIKNYLKSFSKSRFDFVFAFSITMWIHLNHGDEGLKLFLELISNVTQYFVLEPQTYKCYKSAIRRRKRLEEKPFDLSRVSIHQGIEDTIHQIILENGFRQIKEFGNTSWDRKIILYKQKNVD